MCFRLLFLLFDGIVSEHDHPILLRLLIIRVGLQLSHMLGNVSAWSGLLWRASKSGCIHCCLRKLLAALLKLLAGLLDRIGQRCA